MRIGDCFKVLIMAITLTIAWPSRARSQDISIRVKDVPIKKFLDLLQKQSGYVVILIQPVFKNDPHVTISANHQPLEKLLHDVLTPLDAEYVLIEKNIVIRQTATPRPTQKQLRTITGRILDTLGNSIPGASIRLKYDNLAGAISDKEGRFHLFVRKTSGARAMVVSSMGYQTAEHLLIPADSVIIIHLKADITYLDAAQITAYGETTRRLTTAGSQTISAATLSEYPVDNALDAIQDNTTGVFIQRQSGVPGSAYLTRIRGINSLAGTPNNVSQPLIVVDGVAYPGSILPLLPTDPAENQQGGHGLNYLLPDMIESITILKDADALSIYGSRGAYGVILIKTKSGRSHSSGLFFRELTGVDLPGITPHLMNTQQYLTIRREALANDGLTPGPNDLDLNGTWSQTGYINWPKYFYRSHSTLSDSYLTWHDGNDLLSWSIGGGLRYDGGLLVNGNGNKIGGLHYNLNAFQNKKLSLTVLGVYTHTDNTNTPFDPVAFHNDYALLQYAPNAPPMLNPDHSLDWQAWPQGNPAANLRTVYSNLTNNTVTGATLTYKPTNKFTIKLGYGYNAIFGNELEGYPVAFSNPNSTPSIKSSVNRYHVDTWTAEPNGNYTTRLFGKSLLSITLGATAQDLKNYNHGITGTNLTGDWQLTDPGAAPLADQTPFYSGYEKRYLGFFTQLNYNWLEKYILNLGLRRDGSSIFGSARQFGNFYSIGAAYILSKEPWFRQLLPFANFAKLRGSFGTVGGDNVQPGQDAATYIASNTYEGSPGLAPNAPANPYLQWEMDRKWNAALDLHILKDRIAFEFEYYHSHIYNQLLGLGLSYVTGFQVIQGNNPNTIITGYGLECTLRTTNLQGKNFKWTTQIGFSLPRNILSAFPELTTLGITNLQVGQSVQGIQLYDYQGVNPQDGHLLFKNANGQIGEFRYGSGQTLTQNDRYKFLNLSPDYFGSVINTFDLGRWQLDVDAGFVSRLGLGYLGSQFGQPGFINSNYPKEVLARWQKPGDKTNIPVVSTGAAALISWVNFSESTGAYVHAGYWRLNNLYLSYHLTSNKPNHQKYPGDFTVFLQGQNLLTLTRYVGYDPANQGAGAPSEKRLAGGVKLEL